jgi:hypothetical protein
MQPPSKACRDSRNLVTKIHDHRFLKIISFWNVRLNEIRTCRFNALRGPTSEGFRNKRNRERLESAYCWLLLFSWGFAGG